MASGLPEDDEPYLTDEELETLGTEDEEEGTPSSGVTSVGSGSEDDAYLARIQEIINSHNFKLITSQDIKKLWQMYERDTTRGQRYRAKVLWNMLMTIGVKTGQLIKQGNTWVIKETSEVLGPENTETLIRSLIESAVDVASQALGLGQRGRVGDEQATAEAQRQSIANLAERSAEQRAEADRAGGIAQRDENVQASKDIETAGKTAATQAKQQLGIAGAGTAALAGSAAAENARAQMAPGAIQQARQRKDTFEQKEVDRRALAMATGQEGVAEQMHLASESAAYQDMLRRNREMRNLVDRGQNNASSSAQKSLARFNEELEAAGGNQQEYQNKYHVDSPENRKAYLAWLETRRARGN